MPLRLYSHEIAFHTPYLARLATGWLGGHAKGVTAFHLAVADGRVEIIERLKRAGANPLARDDLYHGTPAGWARFHGQPALAERLDAAAN